MTDTNSFTWRSDGDNNDFTIYLRDLSFDFNSTWDWIFPDKSQRLCPSDCPMKRGDGCISDKCIEKFPKKVEQT